MVIVPTTTNEKNSVLSSASQASALQEVTLPSDLQLKHRYASIIERAAQGGTHQQLAEELSTLLLTSSTSKPLASFEVQRVCSAIETRLLPYQKYCEQWLKTKEQYDLLHSTLDEAKILSEKVLQLQQKGLGKTLLRLFGKTTPEPTVEVDGKPVSPSEACQELSNKIGELLPSVENLQALSVHEAVFEEKARKEVTRVITFLQDTSKVLQSSAEGKDPEIRNALVVEIARQLSSLQERSLIFADQEAYFLSNAEDLANQARQYRELLLSMGGIARRERSSSTSAKMKSTVQESLETAKNAQFFLPLVQFSLPKESLSSPGRSGTFFSKDGVTLVTYFGNNIHLARLRPNLEEKKVEVDKDKQIALPVPIERIGINEECSKAVVIGKENNLTTLYLADFMQGTTFPLGTVTDSAKAVPLAVDFDTLERSIVAIIEEGDSLSKTTNLYVFPYSSEHQSIKEPIRTSLGGSVGSALLSEEGGYLLMGTPRGVRGNGVSPVRGVSINHEETPPRILKEDYSALLQSTEVTKMGITILPSEKSLPPHSSAVGTFVPVYVSNEKALLAVQQTVEDGYVTYLVDTSAKRVKAKLKSAAQIKQIDVAPNRKTLGILTDDRFIQGTLAETGWLQKNNIILDEYPYWLSDKSITFTSMQYHPDIGLVALTSNDGTVRILGKRKK